MSLLQGLVLQELHEFQGLRKKMCLFVLQSSDSLRIFLMTTVVDQSGVLTEPEQIRTHFQRLRGLSPNFVSSCPHCRPSMMHSTLIRLRTQPTWLWLLLAMGVLGMGSGRAEASCGDYVLIGNRHAAMLMEMEGQHALSPQTPHVDGWEAVRKSEQSVPCHGPQCRQRKAPKGLPVSVVVSVEHSDAVLAEIADLSPVLQPSVRALAAARLPKEMSGRGLYRPPRIA